MFLADSYPMLDVFWTMLTLFLLVIWLGLLITMFADIIRRHDVSGLVKAAWTVLILILPLVGVLIYLGVEGRNMADRRGRHHERSAAQMDAQLRLRSMGGAGAQGQFGNPHPPA
jgi:hypothetical protein